MITLELKGLYYMKLTEKTLSSDRKFEGKVINLRVDTVELEDGSTATREIVEHPGGVCVISIDDDQNVLMVKQFRAPFGTVLLEVPAGKLNYGEDHFLCGKREFLEETGYTAEKYTYLGVIYPTVGFLTEVLHLYLAEDLTKAEQNLDEDEFLTVESYKLDDLVRMVMANEIKDAKTIISILMLSQRLKNK
jgi:ADP-ribose pyrophosphatase